MKKNLLFSLGTLLLLAGIYLTSCRKTENDLGPLRQFATSGDISVKAGATSAVLTWKEAVNVDSSKSTYTVEIATDTSFTSAQKFTYVVAAPTLTVYDSQLTIRTKYYARVKTNGATPDLDSRWIKGSGAFQLTGEQIFLPVKDAEIKFNSVILRWRDTTGATLVKIVLTPAGGTPTDYPLTKQEADSGFKKIDGLMPSTDYHAAIFSDKKDKGFVDFKTKEVPVYAYTINPTMDLAVVLDTCSPNIIIGLDTGTYTPSTACSLKTKKVTLISVSNNPLDTKVNFKEFKLMGNGAGISFQGIGFDGGTAGLYFINFAGLAADADAATFANVSLENCRVSNYGNCLMRANRGTAAGDQKIGAISINNCVFSNNLLTNQYTEFTFDKFAFQTFSVTNSTFYTVGRALLLMNTALPSGTPIPEVTFDHCTVNNFGVGTNRVLMDANANPVKAAFTNSIFANAPRTGTVSPDAIRATGVGSTVNFSYNDYFKFTNGSAVTLTFPTYVVQTGVQTIDLGWSPTQTDFKIPAGSPLLTASSTGGPIGDPRWL